MIATTYEDITSKGVEHLEPWPMIFDEANAVWTISGDDDRARVPLATIGCQFDDRNGWRQWAAHLMANAEKMYCSSS